VVLVLVGVLFAMGIRHVYALISFGFCLFVALTIIMEFYKGAISIAAKGFRNSPRSPYNPWLWVSSPVIAVLKLIRSKQDPNASRHDLLGAVVELTHRNTRRYGGYLVHMGIVLMFIGFTGHAFNKADTRELSIGDSMNLGAYTLKMVNLQMGDTPVYQWHRATVEVYKGGELLTTLEPEKRFYIASKQGTSEVGIRQRLNDNVYLNFGGMSDDNKRAILQAYVFPLVSWIWIGGLVLIGGTFVCLVPSKVKMQYARTEVVGYTKAHATIQK